MLSSRSSSRSNTSFRARFAWAWCLVFALLGNLVMPLAAHGAASLASGDGVELVPICTAQGVRLVPLSELMAELGDAASSSTGAADHPGDHSSDYSRPTPGGAFGHCDACLGGVNSLAAAINGSDHGAKDIWRSPQVPALASEVTLYRVTYRPEARGPPVIV